MNEVKVLELVENTKSHFKTYANPLSTPSTMKKVGMGDCKSPFSKGGLLKAYLIPPAPL
jgi:hypothetical protein